MLWDAADRTKTNLGLKIIVTSENLLRSKHGGALLQTLSGLQPIHEHRDDVGPGKDAET